MTKLNLTLAKWHYDVVTAKGDLLDNNPYRNFNPNDHESTKRAIAKYHGYETIKELEAAIAVELLKRSLKKRDQSTKLDIYALEDYVGKAAGKQYVFSYLSDITQIVGSTFDELRASFSEQFRPFGNWSWSFFGFNFDVKNDVIVIETWSNIEWMRATDGKFSIHKTEIPMTQRARTWYKKRLEELAEAVTRKEIAEEEKRKLDERVKLRTEVQLAKLKFNLTEKLKEAF